MIERNAWLAKRRTGIAVSDLAPIMGLSPFKTPIQVFMDKLGLVEEREDTLPMKLGRRLEPIIGELFTERTGLTVTPGEIVQHPEHPLILGTPDFLLVDEAAGLEAKSTAWAREEEWGDEMTDLVPMQYLVQCLGYLEVTGREFWYLAVLVGGNRDFRIYRIPRNEETQKRLVDIAETFWHKHIEQQTPPPLDATDSSKAYLRRVFPKHEGEELMQADDATRGIIGAYADAKTQLDKLEEHCDTLKNQICAKIGDAAGIETNGYKITWKASKDSATTDWKTVASKLNPPPDLIAAHTITKPGARRFLLKQEKEQ